MGCVYLVDFDKKIRQYFMQKSSFKKWYKKGYVGIMDFMFVYGCVAWNMSVKLKGVFRTMIDN